MSQPLIRGDAGDGVATLTFDDPDRLNAMTEAMGQAISAEVARLRDDPSVRAVVVTGAGRAFSAGGDLTMLESMAAAGAADPGGPTRERQREFMTRFYGLYLSLRGLPQPTVAAVNGHAIGAGCCVALACDLRIAAREAKLGLNFNRLGIHPGMGATWTLPRLVGAARAAELLYTGRTVSGEEAERIGLVNRVLDRNEVLPAALELAREIAGSAPIAIRQTKESLAESERSTLEEQLAREAAAQAVCYETRDLAEGLDAVQARRDPKFEGR